MDVWIHTNLLGWVLDFPVAEYVHVDLGQNQGLANILQFSPRLSDDILWIIIVGVTQHADGEAILVSQDHV